MVSEHALPSSAKSADRIEGAMMAGGDMAESRVGRQIGSSSWRVGAESQWQGGRAVKLGVVFF